MNLKLKRDWCKRRNCFIKMKCTTVLSKTFCWDLRVSLIVGRTRSGGVRGDGSITIGYRKRWRRWKCEILRLFYEGQSQSLFIHANCGTQGVQECETHFVRFFDKIYLFSTECWKDWEETTESFCSHNEYFEFFN